MNKHLGSSFDEHFLEQFKNPELALELYRQSEADLAKAQAEIEELQRQLSIEFAEGARLRAIIKRKGL